jgi:DNA repair ATPase RecN
LRSLINSLLKIQGQTHEIDLLNERAREILNKSDKPNKEKLEVDLKEVNSEWNGLISELENRKETLTKLAEHWEVYNLF